MVTMDLTMLGQHHCDVKNGLSLPLQVTFPSLLDAAGKPAWALSILRGKRKTFGNLAGHIKGMNDVTSLATWVSSQFDPTLSWRDLDGSASCGRDASSSKV